MSAESYVGQGVLVVVLPPSPSLRRGKLSSNPAERSLGVLFWSVQHPDFVLAAANEVWALGGGTNGTYGTNATNR
jgi:hypothetical protein